jgi:hypothetical protein
MLVWHVMGIMTLLMRHVLHVLMIIVLPAQQQMPTLVMNVSSIMVLIAEIVPYVQL